MSWFNRVAAISSSIDSSLAVAHDAWEVWHGAPPARQPTELRGLALSFPGRSKQFSLIAGFEGANVV